MKLYSEADVDTSALAGKQVAILGYGSQGRAHALNLKDSGFNVVVGLRRDGASWSKAKADGLAVSADPNVQDLTGKTALEYARISRSRRFIRLLQDAGATF